MYHPARVLSEPTAVALGSGPWAGLAWPRPSVHSLRDAGARRRHAAEQLAAELATGKEAKRSTVLVRADATTGDVEPGDERVPTAVAKLAERIRVDGPDGPVVRLTYALAELDGELVHSIALRVQLTVARAWAVWFNGAYDSGQWWEHPARGWPRNVLVREFTALCLGLPYAPPSPRAPAPKGPCPRCGAAVRWTFAGGVARTYAHQRSRMSDTIETRERCE